MNQLIIHIGYHKTATTTLQDALFTQLHKKGKINYLGKSKFENFSGYDLAKDIRNNLIYSYEKNRIKRYFSKDKINIISEESLTKPQFYSIIYGDYENIDPFSYPHKLREILPEKLDIKILVTLRKQIDMVHSWYVQNIPRNINHPQYTEGEFQKVNTWSKFKDYFLQNPKDKFPAYFFRDLTGAWSKVFGKKKVNILFFEEFVNERDLFLKKLSKILNINEKVIRNNFKGQHLNRRKKTENYYIREVEEPKNKAADFFYRKLINISPLHLGHKKIKEKYGKRNKLTVFYRKIIYKEVEKKISKPTEEQEKIFFDIFQENNLKLAKEFRLNEELLKRYGYI